MSRSNALPMKIVFINTEYVETDATSFKSVVQRLTGKDPTMGVAEPAFGTSVKSRWAAEESGVVERSDSVGGGGSVLSKVESFKDFDRLLMEMPPMDELYRLFTN